jgi:large subunit ribosomal protein L21
VARDGDVLVGQPRVEGARVIAEVVEHGRAKKVVVFKYKSKTRYRRKRGHRQHYTRLAVRQILLGDEPLTEEAKPSARPRKRAAAKAKAKPKAEAKAKPEAKAKAKPKAEAKAKPKAKAKPAAKRPKAKAKATKKEKSAKKEESK